MAGQQSGRKKQDLVLDEIKGSLSQLRLLMELQPSFVDQEVVRQGQEIIALFFDPNFGPTINEYTAFRMELLEKAAMDLASGASLLSLCRIGLTYRNGKVSHFAVPYAKPNPPGTLVATVSIKEIRSFEHHRTLKGIDFPQEDLNAAVYYLVSQMALPPGERKVSA